MSDVWKKLQADPVFWKALCDAWEKHKNDPTTYRELAPTDQPIEMEVPNAEVDRQIKSLAALDIRPQAIEPGETTTRIVFRVPSDVGLG